MDRLKQLQELYRRKQLGTGEPLIRPADGQGAAQEKYEEKRRRRGPGVSNKNPNRGGYK
jgi:hypothetical protein